ncbi:MAG TPA: GNAT family N-acetyltransferase [Chthoniobacteraceae bacterium]|jgi:RimJ/RimL family protein N-acetyltransferase
MRPPEVLETERLILRKPVAPDDAPLIFRAYGADPEVTRFLTWEPHRTLEDGKKILRARITCWEDESEFGWVLIEKSSGQLIGMIAATANRAAWRYNLGYVLARTHWNQGLMTEAVIAVTRALFELAGVCRVWAVADAENLGSIRVLEKAGFQREGMLRKWSLHPGMEDMPRDCWCYAQVR